MSAVETSAPARTTWSIDPTHSNVEFAVRHLMITTVKGRFTAVEGTVVLDEANPAASTAEITVQVASIDTREPQRDAHLRSADFFGCREIPDADVPQQRRPRRHRRRLHTGRRPDDSRRHPSGDARGHPRGPRQGSLGW